MLVLNVLRLPVKILNKEAGVKGCEVDVRQGKELLQY